MPGRIVSLVPSLTETLAAWGLTDRLVGVTDWCTSPPLPDVTRVRGTKNPDVAAIVALEPDLVVADQEENRRIDVERLRAAGLEVHVTAARSVAEAASCLEALGPVVGAADPAARLAADMRAALGVPAPVRLRTFCPIWRDPWMAVGNGTIAGDLLGHAGFDVVPARPRYPKVALDEIRAADPDVVLLPSEPYEFGSGDVEAFAGWRAQIRFVDGAQLTWWGPRTVGALASFRALAATVAH